MGNHSPNISPFIMVVENLQLRQENLQSLLSAHGYRTETLECLDLVTQRAQIDNIDLLIITTDSPQCDQLNSIRESTECYLPVLVICNQIDDDLLNRFADVGIDAYITRPVNTRLLLAKIESSLKLRQLYQHQITQRRQLLDYWQLVDLEQEVAAKIFDNVLKSRFLETGVVETMLSPMALFNGDLLLVGNTPDNHLHLLLGDFTGHGLSASIAATPVAEIFYGMTEKGFALADIVAEINAKLYKMLPINMFLAATAVALKPEFKILKLITCGLPDHFLLNRQDGQCKAIRSLNIPLGIQAAFEIEEQSYSVSENDHLYMLTDGVFEAENSEGEAFGAERIIEAIRQQHGLEIDNLQARLSEHTRGLRQKDDITYVKLICDVENIPWQGGGRQQAKRILAAFTWKSSMEFDIDALRYVNPVPVMVNALMEIQGLEDHRQSIFMVVSELFANALDHGLLALDSAIKATPEGFIQFYELKEQRLQTCNQGKIRFLFSHQPTEYGGRLTIKVKDSGAGFDWHAEQVNLDCNQGFSGRGLRLVETLCTHLTYHGQGNRVTAVFDWRK